MSFIFSNLARATLVDTLGIADTVVQVSQPLSERFASPSGGQVQRCSLTDDTTDFELVDITENLESGLMTVTRAVESTSPKEWAAGARLEQIFSAAVITSVALTAGLAAISALTPAANKIIRYTSSSVAELLTLTNAGRDLLDDASAGAMTVTLGLAIGTNVQAYSAALDRLTTAALTTAELAQLASIDTVSISNTRWGYLGATTSFGAAIMAGASVAAQRAALSLDTANTPQFAAIELGAVGDTTLTRISAGEFAVESKQVLTIDNSVAVTGKSFASIAITGGTISGITSFSGRNARVTSVSGALTAAAHANRVVEISGNVSIAQNEFTAGDTIVIIGDASTHTLQVTSGTQKLAGSATTGNLTIAIEAVVLVYFESATVWRASGNVS